MRNATTLTLLAGAAVASAVVAYMLAPAGDPAEIRLGERIFPELAGRAGEVASIEMQRPDGPVVIRREGERWILPETAGYQADGARIRQLFFEVSELRTLEAKTRSKDVYPSLEVEDRDAPGAKSTRVAFRDTQGKEVVALLAGKNRFGRGGGGEDAVYVRRAGDAQAWLARGRLTVNRDALQWMEREVANVARERVRVATIRHADGATTEVSKPSPAERDFVLAGVPEDRKPKSNWEIGSVAAVFERLDLEDVRKAEGFPAGGTVATISTFDGLEVSARLVEIDGVFWAAITARAEPPAQLPEGGTGLKTADEVKAEAEAITRRASPWIYRLPVFNLENMRRKVEDLLEATEG
jgi:hypothetical protein